ncbi:hypothetical protein Y032_0177g609 [Ancylostoma ceylanicum]|uniref:Uncharacterized protein n=1 Tax=Ancylostoma ceylanicum TaxID=53326 RepID=A0A016SUB4_9BILA|nr:hypothetical protein Y032_0177g609 [Ancylostoma ceylanicum]
MTSLLLLDRRPKVTYCSMCYCNHAPSMMYFVCAPLFGYGLQCALKPPLQEKKHGSRTVDEQLDSESSLKTSFRLLLGEEENEAYSPAKQIICSWIGYSTYGYGSAHS